MIAPPTMDEPYRSNAVVVSSTMDVSPQNPVYTANPRAGYIAYKAEIDAAIQSVLTGPHYILGPAVERFEASFSSFHWR